MDQIYPLSRPDDAGRKIVDCRCQVRLLLFKLISRQLILPPDQCAEGIARLTGVSFSRARNCSKPRVCSGLVSPGIQRTSLSAA